VRRPSGATADLTLLAGALALGTGLAALAGAANLATALTFGVLAFTLTLLWVMLRD
jgi:hypothetical protein